MEYAILWDKFPIRAFEVYQVFVCHISESKQ